MVYASKGVKSTTYFDKPQLDIKMLALLSAFNHQLCALKPAIIELDILFMFRTSIYWTVHVSYHHNYTVVKTKCAKLND